MTRRDRMMGCCVLTMALWAGGCSKGADGMAEAAVQDAQPTAETAIRLVYVEQEPGIEPYRSRYIANDRYLRIDDDDQNGDFVLFDRQKKIVFSTSSADRSILEIHERNGTEQPPDELSISKERLPLEGAPGIGGRAAEYHRYSVNGEVCLDQVAVAELAPGIVAALVEFRSVLAGEQRRMAPLTPADMRDSCDLARHAFHVARFMEHGLPVQEWDPKGNKRQLIDMELEFKPSTDLFQLPAGYRSVDMGNLVGG